MDGGNGRAADGRFIPGSRAASEAGRKSRPFSARIGELRSRILEAVSLEDIERILKVVVEMALDKSLKPTDRLKACELLLDRLLGPPQPADILERIEQLEQRFDQEETW